MVGTSPSGDEFGQLEYLWGNILVAGVGTRPQLHERYEPDPPYGVENIQQIRRYLDFLKNIGKASAGAS